MRRRAAALLLALGVGGALAAAPAAPQAPRKTQRIGWLELGPPGPTARADQEAVRQALVGYVAAEDVDIATRHADGRESRLPAVAAELAGAGVDVILAVGSHAAAAAMQATGSVPIVVIAGDAVAPAGANVTGVTYSTAELRKRWLQLVRHLTPAARRVTVVDNPMPAGRREAWSEAPGAPPAMTIHTLEIRDPAGLAQAVAALAEERPDALIVPGDPLTLLNRRRLVELAARNRVPAVYGRREFVDAGGLVAYGPSWLGMYRRAGGMIGKIMVGARPREVPVEQPSRYELIVNAGAAKAIGLALPRSMLLEADQVLAP